MNARGRQTRSALPPLPAALLRAWRHSLASEEWHALDTASLTAACARQLQFGRRRRRGQTLLRVFNDAAHEAYSIVELITEDMSFLVDTLALALAQSGLSVQLVIHPVVHARRDARGLLRALTSAAAVDRAGSVAESWQYLRIDRLESAGECARVGRELRVHLADVRRACDDWQAMRRRTLQLARELKDHPPPLTPEVVDESRALLHYMAGDHFTFLGIRASRLERRGNRPRLVPLARTELGILRRHSRDALPTTTAGAAAAAVAPGHIRQALRSPDVLIITKADRRSTVHRAGYLDYIGVKRYDRQGRVVGETRILGLWTWSAYSADVHAVPWLRYKFAHVIAAFPCAPGSHDGKRLARILETLPRDELLQAGVADLVRCARAVLLLQERARVRVILRRDEFRRFWSCLIYLPRERCDSGTRARVEALINERLRGTQLDSSLAIGDAPLAQLHLVVRSDRQRRPGSTESELERQIAAVLMQWRDRLRAALLARFAAARALELERRYGTAFPASYRQDVAAEVAVADILDLEAAGAEPERMCMRLYRPPAQLRPRVHLRIVRTAPPLSISELLPTFEHFGLRLIAERPYELAPPVATAWVQDFEFEHESAVPIDVAAAGPRIIAALRAVRAGDIDDDGFNRLVIAAGLAAREVSVLRACCRYLLQTGIPFSQSYMERVLANHPQLARGFWQLFERRLAPTGRARPPVRTAAAAAIETRIRRTLEAVRRPDDDRILRAFLAVVRSVLRTNFFRVDAAGVGPAALALKLDPRAIPGMPNPKPAFEIFVHSPRVEGTHLRKGPIARGGIRWSERPEDFRTEILGLMKAQNVKNTLIVPVGAKGGFVARRLRADASRETQEREVAAVYQIFIRCLLDVTDNIVANKVVPPAAVTRLDGDDPYLVVAADKGTASFSDLANAIAADYGFWLGDAFASGGSDGYDHKKLGITARGAWECVKRHFREFGRDIQRADFTVAGIGDMSGDVFGNGMLQSRHIRLLAAFDHRHIFLDPAPVALRSYRERRRLFHLPRSSWLDYDRRLISAGGGVYGRNVKSIALAPQAQRMLALPQRQASPIDVIRAILCMPVDLLWNGGIGTYVKATSERHGDIGDRDNDSVRVDGRQLRARVVGEGGNLGLSQRGRIEYALAGGRVNADFIDNSAGVNTSDIEVNLKILFEAPERGAALPRARRNRLLASLSDEVATLVVRNNYLQSQAISLLEYRAPQELSAHRQLIHWLERHAELDRSVEFLPTDDEIEERRRQGRGLTRPELALLIAYGKIALDRALIDSAVATDPYLAAELQRYFPERLRRRFPRRIERHRLRAQIIATATTNSVVHRIGPDFLMQMMGESAADAGEVARAYTIVRDSSELRALWSLLEGQDGRVEARDQYRAMLQCRTYVGELCAWLLSRRRDYADVGAAVAKLRPVLHELTHVLPGALKGEDRERYVQARDAELAAGLPPALAERLAILPAMRVALDLGELAGLVPTRCRAVAMCHFDLGARLGLDWLHAAIDRLPVSSGWQSAARARLLRASLAAHRRLTAAALRLRARATARTGTPPGELQRWHALLRDLQSTGAPDLAALGAGVEALEELAHRPEVLARLL
ncbi:MAG: NAD-glutamate dehydrogenase [Steroidobacterales bacterium]